MQQEHDEAHRRLPFHSYDIFELQLILAGLTSEVREFIRAYRRPRSQDNNQLLAQLEKRITRTLRRAQQPVGKTRRRKPKGDVFEENKAFFVQLRRHFDDEQDARGNVDE